MGRDYADSLRDIIGPQPEELSGGSQRVQGLNTGSKMVWVGAEDWGRSRV